MSSRECDSGSLQNNGANVNDKDRHAITSDPVAAIFVLSVNQRDDLVRALTQQGFPVFGARRHHGLDRRFILSKCNVAVIDARGDIAGARSAISMLRHVIAAQRGALILILDRDDSAELAGFVASGVTHYLPGGFDTNELGAAVRLGVIAANSAFGGIDPEPPGATDDGQWWTLDLATGDLLTSERMRDSVEGKLDDVSRVRPALRKLAREDRAAAFAAFRRLLGGAITASFIQGAQDLGPAVEEFVHHMALREGELHARVESLQEGMLPPYATLGRDALTGLPDERAATAVIRSRLSADGGGASLLLVEITELDRVNDEAGVLVGDQILRLVAHRAERFARDEWGVDALVARMKGARFAIVAPVRAGGEQLRVESAALCEAVSGPIPIDGKTWRIGCEVAAVTARDAEAPEALLRRAALDLSSDGYVGPTLYLDAAIARKSIKVVFQPQFEVTTNRIVGVEVLARWQHPDLGDLGATPLVAAARKARMLPELTEHIHNLALGEVGLWPQALAGLRVSLNITAEDLARPGFEDDFVARLHKFGVTPDRITVELTEDAMVADINQAVETLTRLRSHGVAIAIDDFGTGYANLTNLRELPLDYLKLDSGMSQDISGTGRDRVIVRAIIELARSLSLSTIAEGVETEEQLSLLAREGCAFYQGFLRAGPVASEELLTYL